MIIPLDYGLELQFTSTGALAKHQGKHIANIGDKTLFSFGISMPMFWGRNIFLLQLYLPMQVFMFEKKCPLRIILYCIFILLRKLLPISHPLSLPLAYSGIMYDFSIFINRNHYGICSSCKMN